MNRLRRIETFRRVDGCIELKIDQIDRPEFHVALMENEAKRTRDLLDKALKSKDVKRYR